MPCHVGRARVARAATTGATPTRAAHAWRRRRFHVYVHACVNRSAGAPYARDTRLAANTCVTWRPAGDVAVNVSRLMIPMQARRHGCDSALWKFHSSFTQYTFSRSGNARCFSDFGVTIPDTSNFGHVFIRHGSAADISACLCAHRTDRQVLAAVFIQCGAMAA